MLRYNTNMYCPSSAPGACNGPSPVDLCQREEIQRLTAKHGAHSVRIFGSGARGDAGLDSDVDLLVDLGPITSAW